MANIMVTNRLIKIEGKVSDVSELSNSIISELCKTLTIEEFCFFYGDLDDIN